MDGRDDSMPRALVVFGIPGLMCLLNLIVHTQLYLNQQRMTLPKTFVRLFGRWGFTVLSTGLANLFIYRAANRPLPPPFAASCGIGLALLLLGGHMMDCPPNSSVALHFSFLEADSRVWTAVHRLAACLWMAAGLGVLIFASVTAGLSCLFRRGGSRGFCGAPSSTGRCSAGDRGGRSVSQYREISFLILRIISKMRKAAAARFEEQERLFGFLRNSLADLNNF